MRSDAWRWFGRGLGLGFGLLIVVAIGLAAVQAIRVIVLVAFSILLAAGLEPAIGWLRSRTGLGRGLTILIVYAAFFAATIALLFLIVPSAISQLSHLNERLPTLLAQAREGAATLRPPAVADAVTSAIDALATALKGIGRGAPASDDLVAVGATIAEAFISIISALTIVFFWLTGHQRFQRFALAMLPAERRRGVREAWNEVETRLGLWVRGQLILMASVFAMTSVAYFVLGLEGALLLATFAAIVEAIPIVGPAIGAIPALLVAATTGRIDLVLLVAGVYVIIQVLEGNVLIPLVMRNTIGVPPFLVIVSLLTGAAIGGVLGALLAVPMTAALVVIMERGQAREQSVPLETGTSASPTAEERDDIERTLPDSPGAASAR